MKNTNYLILIIAFVSLLTACKKDKEIFESKLMIGNAFFEVSNKAQRYTFDVLSNEDIEVVSDADWVSLDSVKYTKGKNKVGFNTTKNDDDERSAVITIRMGADNEKEILVVQETGKAPVFYVKPDGVGDGKSWTNATDIHTALDKATTNSIIYLAAGTYRPNKTIRNGDATNEADKTIEISKNLTLIGGFEVNPTSSSEPNPALYKTVFDGQLSASVSSYHTVTITAAFDSETKVSLEGIVIKGGNATNRGSNVTIGDTKFNRGWGGGMLIANANVELENVEVIENKASAVGGTVGYGAGIYAFNTNLLFRNVKVNNNTGANNGGGLWLADGTLTAINSQFNNNYTAGTAGGLHGYPNATIYLYNSEISNNSNTSYGAGLYVRENSKAYVINCLIKGNKTTSTNGGAGIMQYGGTSVDVISSTIVGNSATGPGGGIYRRSLVNNLTIYNSIVASNTQASTSKDVDIFTESTATNPSIKNSVIMTSVYADAGTIDGTATFSPSSMLNTTTYLPIGTNNPALTMGVNSTDLTSYGNSFTPTLLDLIRKDMFGEERTSKIMGYKVK